MFVYAFRQYSASQIGSVVRQVRCEKCGGDFTCEVIRRAKGYGHSPYGFFRQSAQAEAVEEARWNLNKKLKTAVEPVPCPKCGWFQLHMVKELRRRDLRWMLWTAWIGAALAWLSAAMGWVTATEAFSQPIDANRGAGVLALIAGGAVWAMVIIGTRNLLGTRIDPNKNHASRPTAEAAHRVHRGFGFNPALAKDMENAAAARVKHPLRAAGTSASRVHG